MIDGDVFVVVEHFVHIRTLDTCENDVALTDCVTRLGTVRSFGGYNLESDGKRVKLPLQRRRL